MALIILVDDEADFLEIATLKLRGKGFETFATTDGQVAVAKAEELQPDLVLSDIYMPPGPNGWEVALALHRNPKTCTIKIAFFTSLSDPWAEVSAGIREEIATKLGIPIFLSKVDDIEVLGEKVKTILA
jgi:CheY-like chemotaxis protein